MQYYEDLQYLAQIDQKDSEIGKVEKWEAHEKGILHRALTVVVFFENNVVLQHRKHLVFDSVFDLTVSTHQFYKGEKLIDDHILALQVLKREMNLHKSDLLEKPKSVGKIQYEAKDPNSKYSENEICHIMTCKAKKIKIPNLDFAYGFTVQKLDSIAKPNHYLYSRLAPWVKILLAQNII